MDVCDYGSLSPISVLCVDISIKRIAVHYTSQFKTHRSTAYSYPHNTPCLPSLGPYLINHSVVVAFVSTLHHPDILGTPHRISEPPLQRGEAGRQSLDTFAPVVALLCFGVHVSIHSFPVLPLSRAMDDFSHDDIAFSQSVLFHIPHSEGVNLLTIDSFDWIA